MLINRLAMQIWAFGAPELSRSGDSSHKPRPPAHVQSRRGRLPGGRSGHPADRLTEGVASAHRVAAGFRLGPSEVPVPMGSGVCVHHETCDPRRGDSARGGAGLFVRSGCDRSDSSGPGGVRLVRGGGVLLFCWRSLFVVCDACERDRAVIEIKGPGARMNCGQALWQTDLYRDRYQADPALACEHLHLPSPLFILQGSGIVS